MSFWVVSPRRSLGCAYNPSRVQHIEDMVSDHLTTSLHGYLTGSVFHIPSLVRSAGTDCRSVRRSLDPGPRVSSPLVLSLTRTSSAKSETLGRM